MEFASLKLDCQKWLALAAYTTCLLKVGSSLSGPATAVNLDQVSLSAFGAALLGSAVSATSTAQAAVFDSILVSNFLNLMHCDVKRATAQVQMFCMYVLK